MSEDAVTPEAMEEERFLFLGAAETLRTFHCQVETSFLCSAV